MRLARVLGAVGRTMITAGTLILLFVAYQLWGTGLREAQSQDKLKSQFDAALTSAPTTDPATPTATTATTEPLPPPSDGGAVAHIVIPKIGVDKIVVEGVSLPQLKKGPGHYPDSPMPGQPGNASIAGHRTTYGAPFGSIDQLVVGDEILITTLQGSFHYVVSEQQIVRPSEVAVLEDKGDNRLTLTSCHPKYSARQRIVVVAQLTDKPAPAPPPSPTTKPKPATIDAGIDGVRADKLPAVLWGVGAAAIWIAAWLLGRRWRKWPSYAIGLLPFLVVLYFFFENFARLLPSNF
jgi:sortase A